MKIINTTILTTFVFRGCCFGSRATRRPAGKTTTKIRRSAGSKPRRPPPRRTRHADPAPDAGAPPDQAAMNEPGAAPADRAEAAPAGEPGRYPHGHFAEGNQRRWNPWRRPSPARRANGHESKRFDHEFQERLAGHGAELFERRGGFVIVAGRPVSRSA